MVEITLCFVTRVKKWKQFLPRVGIEPIAATLTHAVPLHHLHHHTVTIFTINIFSVLNYILSNKLCPYALFYLIGLVQWSTDYWLKYIFQRLENEGSRGAAVRSVTVKPTCCGFDPHSRKLNIYLNLCFLFFALVSRLSATLSSATQHAMCVHSTECFNFRFPLPTLLCAGYSVKLIYLFDLFYRKLRTDFLYKI